MTVGRVLGSGTIAAALLGAAGAWLAASGPGESGGKSPDHRPRPGAPESDPRRERIREAERWWARMEPVAYGDVEVGDWPRAAARLVTPDALRHRPYVRTGRRLALESAILRAASGGHGEAEGLRAALAWARRVQVQDSDAESTHLAGRVLEWGSARALAPYVRDHLAYVEMYDAVRRGPVREYQFGEAALHLARQRSRLETWHYERRLLRKVERLERMQDAWEAFVVELASGSLGWEGLDRDRPPTLDAFTVSDPVDGGHAPRRRSWAALTPDQLASDVVLPRVSKARPSTAAGLAFAFAELGLADASENCLDVGASSSAFEPGAYAALRREIAALRAPRGGSEEYEATDVALFDGPQGAQAVGTLTAQATDAFLSGGIVWAPQQWETIASRAANARPAEAYGTSGWRVGSLRYDVFSDVSPMFAAQAAHVLDAAFEQVGVVLGRQPTDGRRMAACIWARPESFRARFRTRAGGYWVPSERTVYTYASATEHGTPARWYYSVLVHEAAHSRLDAALGPRVPCWLGEGLATYFGRWNPARSIGENQARTGAAMSGGLRDTALRERRKGTLPDLGALLQMRTKWVVDDFGPLTRARYAAAESLLVHLMSRAPGVRLVHRWLDDVACGREPGLAEEPAEFDEVDTAWRAYLDEELPETSPADDRW